MGILVFILVCFSALAQQMLSPAVQNMDTLFPKNKEIFLQCLNKYPSKDRSHGCVDSYKYFRGLCDLVQENKFEQRYNGLQVHKIYQACKLVDKGDNRLPGFFELDAKACVQGFETLSDQLMTYNTNKNLIEEAEEMTFLYMYEKNSCTDYRMYVNFCSYVDGLNRTGLPLNNEYLPKPDFGKKPGEVCKPSKPGGEGLFTINHDLAEVISDQRVNPYNTLILKYRARLPASTSTFSACEQVRTGYTIFGCAKFEKVKDGKPEWAFEEDEKADAAKSGAAKSRAAKKAK